MFLFLQIPAIPCIGSIVVISPADEAKKASTKESFIPSGRTR